MKHLSLKGNIMDLYDSLFSTSTILNEQLCRELFSLIPEHGPLVLFLDKEGNHWSSDEEASIDILEKEEQVKKMCVRIDDGADPIISQFDDYGVYVTQLKINETDCGYLFILMNNYTPEMMMCNLDVVETVANLIFLAGKLIDKNNQLHQAQLKFMSHNVSRLR